MIKSDLKEKWPVIWRVDGKTLLEKFAPFEEDGQTLYRNVCQTVISSNSFNIDLIFCTFSHQNILNVCLFFLFFF